MMQKNVFGLEIEPCSENPVTGFYRDGSCNTGKEDTGQHTVCVVLTKEFLEFSKIRGNDLSTPMPQYNFPGLKPGDHWCLCALRWMEAYYSGMAPQLVLEATNEEALELISMDMMLEFAFRKVEGIKAQLR
ncbi:MAG: DUF2237 domain-containing protein [Bacteroidales bacterium]|nr:DUF2237 domain-containing protein [Bacteroidales bacterium]MCF8458272.1 DUF2237 domain-containing protein [Bacteroidales bacterium]